MKHYAKDIGCSDWGPYSNKAVGLSHILPQGHLMTVFPLPGYMSWRHPFPQMREYRGDFEVLRALPDLSYYAFRYIIDPDRSVFADAEYFSITDDSALITTKYSHRGTEPKNMQTFLLFSFEPSAIPAHVKGDGIVCLSAADYEEVDVRNSRWSTDLPYGVRRDFGATERSALDFHFCRTSGARWVVPARADGATSVRLRYSLGEGAVALILEHEGRKRRIVLRKTGSEYDITAAINIRMTGRKPLTISMERRNKSLKLDCLIFCRSRKRPFVERPLVSPDLTDVRFDPSKGLAHLKLEGLRRRYGVRSDHLAPIETLGARRHYYPLNIEDLEESCRLLNIVNMVHYAKILTARHMAIGARCFVLKPGTTHTESFLIGTGIGEKALLGNLARGRTLAGRKTGKLRAAYRSYASYFRGDMGNFTERLAAQTACNICYPETLRKKPVRFYTPGKRYGSFYLWDMGMMGLGLNHMSADRGEELLNQYFKDDDGSPFVFWGTTLPIHISLYWQNFVSGGSLETLRRYFGPALRMYRFFTGDDPGSVMRDRSTGLISNFHYFYNSGGWDDYPAQRAANHTGRADIFPVVALGQTILAAKLLRQTAFLLNKDAVVETLSRDIVDLEKALFRYQWNRKEGLFSYYDKRDRSFLRIDGEEANKGMDGYYPLVSQSVPLDMAERMRDILMDSRRFLTPYGLTTVDKTAGYFRDDGYWNGHVWVPHNWFYWKAFLGYGFAEQARVIASRLLAGFAAAYERDRNVVECLHHRLGTSEHVPYFTGLTAPLLDMYDAYYGRTGVTCGFQLCPALKKTKYGFLLKLRAPFYRGPTSAIVRMEPETRYGVTIGSRSVGVRKTDAYGCLELNVDVDAEVIECRFSRKT